MAKHMNFPSKSKAIQVQTQLTPELNDPHDQKKTQRNSPILSTIFTEFPLLLYPKMQQRPTGSSSREIGEGYTVSVVQKALPWAIAHSSPRIRIDHDDEGHILPVSDRRPSPDKKEIGRPRMVRRWVHLIPVVVVLCFLIPWWLSYPVKLVRKDGRIVSVEHLEIPREFKNDDRIDRKIMEQATSPVASMSRDFEKDNENEAPTENGDEGQQDRVAEEHASR